MCFCFVSGFIFFLMIHSGTWHYVPLFYVESKNMTKVRGCITTKRCWAVVVYANRTPAPRTISVILSINFEQVLDFLSLSA